jgi:hypothetical protein
MDRAGATAANSLDLAVKGKLYGVCWWSQQEREMRATAFRGLIAFSLSLCLEAYVLYYAYHYGTLRGLLQWDDCSVILRGIVNLDLIAHAKSIWGILCSARYFQIHAPLSDIQTMLGLLLSGGQIWGPYWLNAGWLALVLFAVLETSQPQNWCLTAAVALFVVVQPVTISALTYVKSDWQGGLLLAGALFLLSAGVERARPGLKLFGATLLGLSVLSKLTALYLPILALAILLLFEWHPALLLILRRLGLRSNRERTLGAGFSLIPADRRAFALSVIIAVCPFLLFFAYKARYTINYIRSAMGATWDDGFTTLERVRYYSPLGQYSWASWGNLHIFSFIFVGTALWIAARSKNLDYLVTLFILVVIATMFFIPLIVPRSSNISFAATFLGVITAATLISMDFIARSFPRWGSVAILAVTVLVALPMKLPFQSTAYYALFPVTGDELSQLSDTYGRIVDVMSEHAHTKTPKVVVFYDDVFAPHPNLAIEYFRKTGHLPAVDLVQNLSDTGVTSQLSNADFVLTIVPSASQPTQMIPNLYPAYPISHDPARADGVVRAFGRFDLVGAFAVRGGEIHLYDTVSPTKSSKKT